MCDLCSTDEKTRELGRVRAESMARYLERLASVYLAIARGTIKPHTNAMQEHGAIARGVIRDLVDEWV